MIDTADLGYRLRTLRANREAFRTAQRWLSRLRFVMGRDLYAAATARTAAILAEMDESERRIEAGIAAAHAVTTIRAN